VPLYDYRCEAGHVTEVMRPYEDRNDPHLCACGQVGGLVWLKMARVVGPVFSDLEAYEGALLTKKQREAGVRITSKADIERIEAQNGFTRVDPNSAAHRARIADQKDEAREIEKVKATGDRTAVADYLAKTTMQQATGWSDTKYSQWKEMKDAAEQRVQSGAAARHVEPVQPVGG